MGWTRKHSANRRWFVRLFIPYFDRAAASAAAVEDLVFQDRRRWYAELVVGLLDSNRNKLRRIRCKENARAGGRGHRAEEDPDGVRSGNNFIKPSAWLGGNGSPALQENFG